MENQLKLLKEILLKFLINVIDRFDTNMETFENKQTDSCWQFQLFSESPKSINE